MNVFNMKPAWLQVVEEAKKELGRELTKEEVSAIRNATMNYATNLAHGLNMAADLEGRETKHDNIKTLSSNITLPENTIPTIE